MNYENHAQCLPTSVRGTRGACRSPSCGVKQRYDGTFTGTLVDVAGVAAQLLKENQFHVFDVEDLIAIRERKEVF